MLKSEYDTVIVGAGPAGLACALSLYENGVTDILVIDRSTFPRDKCCAGYITKKTKTEYEKFGVNFNDCPYNLIDDFNILYGYKIKQQIKNKFLYTSKKINRVDLDFAFYNTAKKRGIDIAEDTRANGLDREYLSVIRGTDEYKIKFKNLVFADGCSGFSSKFIKNRKKNIAMQLIFDCNTENKIDIHFGVTKRGYGWVSAYNGRVNVGLTDVYQKDIDYRAVFEEYLKKLGYGADLTDLKAAFTPIGVIPSGFRKIKNVYFTGDALGACDPLTLSGLRYAIQSGKAAAEAIASGNRKKYDACADRLRIRFSIMRAMCRVFYFKPVTKLIFNVGCRFFGGIISSVFNNYFVNKK